MDNFTQELLVRLDGKIPDNELKQVIQEVTMLLANYDISKKETSVIPYSGLPECYKVFLVTKKIEGKTEATLKAYKYQLEYFFQYIMKPVDEITSNDIIVYLYQMKENGRTGKPLSATATDNIRLILNSFFTWAVGNDYILKNPMYNIKRIQGERKKRKSISEGDLEKLRDTMDGGNINKKWKNEDVGLRDRAMFEFILSTGARLSEVARLNKDDVDFTSKEVHLFGKGRKHRTSYINAKAEYYLKKYLQNRVDDDPALFVSIKKPYKRIGVGGIEETFRKYNVVLNDGRLFPHRLRHTMATNAINHGMELPDLQSLLGHEKADTTMIYAHLCDEEIKGSHRKYVV